MRLHLRTGEAAAQLAAVSRENLVPGPTTSKQTDATAKARNLNIEPLNPKIDQSKHRSLRPGGAGQHVMAKRTRAGFSAAGGHRQELCVLRCASESTRRCGIDGRISHSLIVMSHDCDAQIGDALIWGYAADSC